MYNMRQDPCSTTPHVIASLARTCSRSFPQNGACRPHVYAYGIVVNELETRARPWEATRSAMAIGRKVTQGKRPEPAAGGAVGVLIGRCWANKPLERPCMIQVLAELRTL